MGLPFGIGPRIPPTPSSNQYRKGMVDVLLRIGTSTSELNTPHVGLRASPEETPINLPSPLPINMIYVGYPPPNTVRQPFSGRGPHYGYDPSVSTGIL